MAAKMLHLAAKLDQENQAADAKKRDRKEKAQTSPIRKPSSEEMRYYADWLLRSGDDQPRKTYQAAQQMHRAARLDEPSAVEQIVDMVNELRKERKYGAALRLLAKTTQARSDNAMLARLHGEFLLVAGNAQQAIIELRRAQRLDPNDPITITQLGSALERVGNLDEAVHILHQGHAAHPDHTSITALLGRVLSFSDRHQAAIDVLQDSLIAHPADARLNSALGEVLLDKGDYAAFDKAMMAVPERTAKNTLVIQAIARSKLLRHEPEVARRVLEPVVLKQEGITTATALYIACAENDDPTLLILRKRYGEKAFERAVVRAQALRPDRKFWTVVSSRHNAQPSSVLGEGAHLTPVNRVAMREFSGRDGAKRPPIPPATGGIVKETAP